MKDLLMFLGFIKPANVYRGCFPPSGKCVKKITEWNVKKPALFEPTIGGEFAGFSEMR
ncbi:MAG: hypothetical protein JXB00_02895 [Bacteroidales bacterium]|nr:hypothetical protein [Bacteroidales bacterium]